MATFNHYGVIAVVHANNGKRAHTNITHFSIVSVNDNGTLSIGNLFTKEKAIELIKGGNKMFTYKWNYVSSGFEKGEEVKIFPENGIDYLRTTANNTVTDNLQNLINYEFFQKINS